MLRWCYAPRNYALRSFWIMVLAIFRWSASHDKFATVSTCFHIDKDFWFLAISYLNRDCSMCWPVSYSCANRYPIEACLCSLCWMACIVFVLSISGKESVEAICFRCLPQWEGTSFARKGLSAQPGSVYHLIGRQACSPWHIIAIEISTSCFSLPVVDSGIGWIFVFQTDYLVASKVWLESALVIQVVNWMLAIESAVVCGLRGG